MTPVNHLNLGGPVIKSVSVGEREVLNEEAFQRMIAVERKRTERSRKPFLLMLLDAGDHQGSERNGKALDSIVSSLLSSITGNRRNRLVQRPEHIWRDLYGALGR